MNKTTIESVKNPDGTQGYTWNPITGCLNHVNGMCKGGNFPCYAYRLANGRLKATYLANENTAPDTTEYGYGLAYAENWQDPFYPRFWPARLPTYFEGKPRGVFVCDMSDLFGIGIPESWTREVLGTIKRSPTGWRFYLLTKQPQNLIKFSPFPDNCWVGVTVTNNASLDSAIIGLADIQASKRFISFEPLLLPVNFSEEDAELLDWLIIGAQTRPTVYPKIEWVKEIVEAADKAGIPVFLKENLRLLLTKYRNYGAFFQDERRLRQEMPNG